MTEKDNSIAMLKAKLHLDLIDIQINLLPDQPDMLDELNGLYTQVDVMDEEIRAYQVKIEDMSHEIEERSDD